MEICTVGSVRGESVGLAMVDLNGHEAGNGGHSQGTPTAHRPPFYSERCPVTALIRTYPPLTTPVEVVICDLGRVANTTSLCLTLSRTARNYRHECELISFEGLAETQDADAQH